MRLLWADLHNHNEVGYGKGSLERSYQLARNLLDVYAFTPHGWWPDAPSGDPKVRDYHMNAFDEVEKAFPAVRAMANEAYTPGEFVTFVGYEWHSSAWGDYHVIFPGESGSILRASHVQELQDFARRTGALLIPHHCAYRLGCRGTNWQSWQADVSPLAEAFSEHGNSLEDGSHFPMTGHSMGGSITSQSILAQLRGGKRLGLTAGTDNHFGHPASYEEGITGIWAEDRTRESVFRAFRSRHTYAATGDRIELAFRSGDALMGDHLGTEKARQFQIDVMPLAPISFVQVIRNGDPIATWAPVPPRVSVADGRTLLRLDWGWGLLDGSALCAWDIRLAISGGALNAISPCMGGGASSTTLLNRIHRIDPDHAHIESFTSRLNPNATNGVVLDLFADAATELSLSVKTHSENTTGGFDARVSLKDLDETNMAFDTTRKFSSPKLVVGRTHRANDLRFRMDWVDPDPGPTDWYMLKVQQQNGQCAWSSPIWFAGEGE